MMTEPEDYWRGHSDAITEIATSVALAMGDTPVTDDTTIKFSELGAIMERVRSLADAKPIPGVDPE